MKFSSKIVMKFADIYNLHLHLKIDKDLLYHADAIAFVNWEDVFEYNSYGIDSISASFSDATVELEYSYYETEKDQEESNLTYGDVTIYSHEFQIDSEDFKLQNGQLLIDEVEIDFKFKTIKII